MPYVYFCEDEHFWTLAHFEISDVSLGMAENFRRDETIEKCDVCGNYPIIDVSVIRNEDGGRLNSCYGCIDRITNRNVSSWFKTFRKKRENIMENRKYIDCLSSILTVYEYEEFPFQISSEVVENLHKTYVQICNGLNSTTKQKQLAEHYISYNVEILRG